LTLSDLNKAPILATIYVILSEIETTLAQLIDVACTDPWEWIQKLSRQRQAQVLGYWELAKKQNVDAGAILSCTLGDLVIIGRKIDPVRNVFVFRNIAGRDALDCLRDLRNRVAHPIAPLVRGIEDVKTLGATLTYAVEMLSRLNDHQVEG